MIALSTFRQYLATICCHLCTAASALSFVWFTPLMTSDRLQKEIPVSSDDLGWLIAFIEVGELFAPLPTGYLADRWGRKPSLLLTFPLFVSSWIVTVMTRSLTGLYIARSLQGIATGMIYTVAPIYVVEISHPNIRGELSGHLQSLWFIGVLYSYCTGPYVSYNTYAYLSSVPAFLFLATFVFMPETPYFLAMKGRRNLARKSLEWLRGTIEVTQEMDSIEETVAEENKNDANGWKELLTSKHCRKPLFIVSFICIIKYLSGTTTITNYATETFSKGGMEDSADLASIIIAVILLVTTVIAAFFADHFGRKPLILASTLGIGIGSTMICVYFFLTEDASPIIQLLNTTDARDPLIYLNNDTDIYYQEMPVQDSYYDWILYTGFSLYCVATNIGIGPLQTTIQAEYFPSHVRATAGAFTTLLSNFFVFFSIKQYQVVQDYIGVYANYLFFAIISYFALFILCPFMEETAKKSLGEIQAKRT